MKTLFMFICFMFLIGCYQDDILQQNLIYTVEGSFQNASVIVYDNEEPIYFDNVNDYFVYEYQFVKSELMFYRAEVYSENWANINIVAFIDDQPVLYKECFQEQECILSGYYGTDTATVDVSTQ